MDIDKERAKFEAWYESVQHVAPPWAAWQARAALARQDTAPPAAVPAPDECPACASTNVRQSHVCRDCGCEYANGADLDRNAKTSRAAAPAQAVDARWIELIDATSELMNANVAYDIANTTQFDQIQKAAARLCAARERCDNAIFACEELRAALAAQPAEPIPVWPDHQKDDHERMMATLSREPSPEAQAFYDELLGKPVAPARVTQEMRDRAAKMQAEATEIVRDVAEISAACAPDGEPVAMAKACTACYGCGIDATLNPCPCGCSPSVLVAPVANAGQAQAVDACKHSEAMSAILGNKVADYKIVGYQYFDSEGQIKTYLFNLEKAEEVCHKTVCGDRCSFPRCMGPLPEDK